MSGRPLLLFEVVPDREERLAPEAGDFPAIPPGPPPPFPSPVDDSSFSSNALPVLLDPLDCCFVGEGNRCLAWEGECPEEKGVSGTGSRSSSSPVMLPALLAPPTEEFVVLREVVWWIGIPIGTAPLVLAPLPAPPVEMGGGAEEEEDELGWLFRSDDLDDCPLTCPCASELVEDAADSTRPCWLLSSIVAADDLREDDEDDDCPFLLLLDVLFSLSLSFEPPEPNRLLKKAGMVERCRQRSMDGLCNQGAGW